MRYGVLDVESSIFAKGHPYAEKNKLCLVGLRLRDTSSPEAPAENHIWKIEYGDSPYADALRAIAELLATLDTCVVFNGKFDFGWLARYGIVLPEKVKVFDCQLAEFILDHQRNPYPSLDGCLSKYGLGSKLNVVEEEYWALGIDTTEIPLEVLVPYLETDLEKTDALYLRFLSEINQRGFYPLVSLHMQDLRVLQEMEQNGLLFDWDGMATEAERVAGELASIDEQIRHYVPSEYRDHFNPESGDDLSCILYGGIKTIPIGTEYSHTYKTGPKIGLTETRRRWEERSFKFERLVQPPEGSGLKKDGYFSVDEETLISIRHKSPGTRDLVHALLSRSELEKLLGTYYHGIPAKCEKYDWQDGLVHGIYNQCRVITGRLSSEKPNLQNMPDPLMQFIISRYHS